MSHERLIAQLAAGVEAVTPLASPRVRAARWVLLALAATAVAIVVKGVRSNWIHALEDPWFMVTEGLILATGLVSALLAMALSVPGAIRAAWVKWTPVGLLFAWGGVLLAEVVLSGESVSAGGRGIGCLWKTYGIAIGPAVTIVYLARRAAPLDWRWTGCLAAVAALSFGVLGTEFICPITSSAHLFNWHFLPVVAMALIAFVAAAMVTRR